jgi:hypothetical protein
MLPGTIIMLLLDEALRVHKARLDVRRRDPVPVSR